ncbi:MAG: SPOR domain-containing protein [Desulfarculaceae bacterium]
MAPDLKTPSRTAWPRRMIWGLLTAFLIVWAFVLGILVGQGVLANPEHLAAAQKWLGLSFQDQEPGPGKAPAPHTQSPPQKLSFYQGVQTKEGAIAPKPASEAKAAKAAQPQAPPPKGSYIVQVASFKEEGQALSLIRSLKAAGFPCYIMQAQVQGVGLRFRVRVGPFAKLEEATGAAGRIRLKHKLAAYVTRQE